MGADIKMDLKEIGTVRIGFKWLRVSDQWQAVMNTVMNLWFRKRREIY
jgi:hypothetical protein